MRPLSLRTEWIGKSGNMVGRIFRTFQEVLFVRPRYMGSNRSSDRPRSLKISRWTSVGREVMVSFDEQKYEEVEEVVSVFEEESRTALEFRITPNRRYLKQSYHLWKQYW
jgi:hypothetical protein